jgi:hypothetical protein
LLARRFAAGEISEDGIGRAPLTVMVTTDCSAKTVTLWSPITS